MRFQMTSGQWRAPRARLARPKTEPEALLESYALEALHRHRGRPEFQVMPQ